MPLSTYADLKTELADWSNRSDLSAKLPTFIALCESDMQVRCKLVEFEGEATVAVTSGAGALPTGFTGMRSLYLSASPKKPLKYVTPDLYEEKTNLSGDPIYYTISGDSVLVAPAGDCSVVMRYTARFTPLSDSDTTNVLLTNYPDAYLHGSLLQLHLYTKNTEDAKVEADMFEAAIARIKLDNRDRKYAGVALEVKAR